MASWQASTRLVTFSATPCPTEASSECNTFVTPATVATSAAASALPVTSTVTGPPSALAAEIVLKVAASAPTPGFPITKEEAQRVEDARDGRTAFIREGDI